MSDFYETKSRQKVKGLIPILKEYYFTIEENTPLEQEIALDPELLGKIFENLLASYNPETRTTARKLTGSFYTPREIVNYIVDESLIAYLKTKLTQKLKTYQEFGNQQTNIFGNEGTNQSSLQLEITTGKWDDKEELLEKMLRDLFGYETDENPFQDDTETTNAIISHLSECKILDPACGSGAFPMGVLHQIVHALKKLDSDNEQWKKVQYERLIAPEVAKINNDISTVQKLSSDETRKMAEVQLKHELEELLENFARHDHNYTRKLHLIENCIYGVDIQTIAIHISKLRFFISLLVDQNIDFNQRNKNYLLNSLPNLETKFVAANTLIPLNSGGQLKTRELNIINIEEKIKAERKKYFDCKSREEKLKIEKKDEALRIEFAAALKKLTEQGKNNLLLKIESLKAEINTYIHYKAKAQTDRDKTRIAKGIDSFKKDLEKQTQQLIQFEGGDEVANKILHFNPYDANSSAPFFDPEIMFALQPSSQTGFFDIILGNPPYGIKFSDEEIKNFRRIYNTVIGHSEAYYLFIERGINLLNNDAILAYITPNAWLSNKYAKEVRNLILRKNKLTILINLNKKFVFENAGVETSIFLITNNQAEYSNVIVGNDIDELKLFDYNIGLWLTNENLIIGFSDNQVINNIFEKIKETKTKLSDLIDLSNGFKPYQVGYGKNLDGKPLNLTDIEKRIYHSPTKLDSNYKKQIKGKNVTKYCLTWTEGYIKWGGWLMSPKEMKYFENPKILIRQIIDETLICTYDEKKYYADQSLYIAINYPNIKISLKYCTAILNSKLMGFYFRKFYSEEDALFPKIKVNELKDLPLKDADSEIQHTISLLVDKALLEKQPEKSLLYASILDLMVYKLYSLTYKECQIIDAEIERLISPQEYENTNITDLAKINIYK